MGEDSIPDDLKAFLTEHIDSVLLLEILLLLRADSQRAWTHQHVARNLRMEPTWAAGVSTSEFGLRAEMMSMWLWKGSRSNLNESLAATSPVFQSGPGLECDTAFGSIAAIGCSLTRRPDTNLKALTGCPKSSIPLPIIGETRRGRVCA